MQYIVSLCTLGSRNTRMLLNVGKLQVLPISHTEIPISHSHIEYTEISAHVKNSKNEEKTSHFYALNK